MWMKINFDERENLSQNSLQFPNPAHTPSSCPSLRMLWVGSKACESNGQDPTGIQQVGHECQASVGMPVESHISHGRSQTSHLGLK